MQNRKIPPLKKNLFLYFPLKVLPLKGLGLLLATSIFTQPVQGMLEDGPVPNWSKVFYKPQHHNVIGAKVLSYLDEGSLGKAAQVNQEWQEQVEKRRILGNPCFDTLPELLVSSQVALNKNILISLGAVPDPFTPLIHEVRKLCEALSPNQKTKANRLLPNLTNPSLSLYPWHLWRGKKTLKEDTRLNPQHEGFKRLGEVVKNLELLKSDKLIVNHPIASRLQHLQNKYKTYIEDVCSFPMERRTILLFPVILTGNFLKGSYLISKFIADELISMGEHGVPVKKNEQGSSIVSDVGQIYGKQNFLKAPRYSDQGLEMMLFGDLKQSLAKAPQEIQELVNEYYPDLFCTDKLSPYLFVTKGIIFDPFLTPNHSSLQRLNEAICLPI